VADGQIQIRKLEGTDEADLCARLMAGSEPWITLGRSYEDSLKILVDKSKDIYVAVVDQVIVGFIIINMNGSFVGYIQTVCVKPEMRNKGIGSILLNWAEQRIFSETPNVFMCVSSFNKEALKLYEKLGYEVIGELRDYIVAGHSEILLRKTIAPMTEFKAS